MIKEERRRMNIKLPEEIIDFYKEMGDRYSVPYTNYISMLLTQIYEREKEKQLVSDFNETIKQMKTMTDGSMTSEEMLKEFKSMVTDLQKLDNEHKDK